MAPPAPQIIRVLVADDHPMIRRGLSDMLALSPRITVVAEAADGREALALYRQHRPDVAIVDVRMPGMDGIELMRTIRAEDPKAHLIALSSFKGDEDIHGALEAGALAYLFKTVLAKELIATVEAAHAGRKRLGPAITGRLEERMGGPSLTRRELEVLQQMVQGKGNDAIALDLGMALETVRVHVKRLLGKLGVGNRTQAVASAIERGIVHLD